MNPITNKTEIKHLQSPPKSLSTDLTTLYTLIIEADSSFEILVNRESVRKGSLLEDFDPPVNPPLTIPDPAEKQPEWWDDREMIADPFAIEPVDWNKGVPEFIPDLSAKQPEGWLADEPLFIKDANAVKPDSWTDEIDGEWLHPTIPNSKCTIGCGKWTAPLIRNPLHKGKWTPPLIKNPKYQGPWSPKQIPNPDYFHDLTPNRFPPISAVGIEVWSLEGGLLFDNILLTHDRQTAKDFAEATWVKKNGHEREAMERHLQNHLDLFPLPKEYSNPVFDKLGPLGTHLNKAVDRYLTNPENFKAEYAFPVFVISIALVLGAVIIRALCEKVFNRKTETPKKEKLSDDDGTAPHIPSAEIQRSIHTLSPPSPKLADPAKAFQRRFRMGSSPLQYHQSQSAPNSPSHLNEDPLGNDIDL